MSRELKNGDELTLLNESQALKGREISFIFVVLIDFYQTVPSVQQIKAESNAKVQPSAGLIDEKMRNLADHFECSICYQVLYKAVSVMPCMHTFCGGCLSDWFKKQKECPNC